MGLCGSTGAPFFSPFNMAGEESLGLESCAGGAAPGGSGGAASAGQAVLHFHPRSLCDFTLICSEGVELHVHKAILAQRCGFFAGLAEAVGGSAASLRLTDSWPQVQPLLRQLYPEAPQAEPEPAPAEAEHCATDADGGGPSASAVLCGGRPWQPAVASMGDLRLGLEAAHTYDCPSLLAACDQLLSSGGFCLAGGRWVLLMPPASCFPHGQLDSWVPEACGPGCPLLSA